MTGSELIAAERQRQVEREGWTPEHDDAHHGGQLSAAGACYLFHAGARIGLGLRSHGVPKAWPWEPSSWKPSDDPIRNLVKAGALIAAEIDRLQRLRQPVEEG